MVAAVARSRRGRRPLGFQGGDLSYAAYRTAAAPAPRRAPRRPGRVAGVRLVKDETEVADPCGVRARWPTRPCAPSWREGLVGRREDDVAWRISEELHRLGAEGESFAAIVAGGPHGALAHAIPGERRIRPGELVVIDMGARVDGYCSDITRTFATGELDDEAAPRVRRRPRGAARRPCGGARRRDGRATSTPRPAP